MAWKQGMLYIYMWQPMAHKLIFHHTYKGKNKLHYLTDAQYIATANTAMKYLATQVFTITHVTVTLESHK